MSKNGKYYRKTVKRAVDDKGQRSLFTCGVKRSKSPFTQSTEGPGESDNVELPASGDQTIDSHVTPSESHSQSQSESNKQLDSVQPPVTTHPSPTLPLTPESVCISKPSTDRSFVTDSHTVDSYDGRKAVLLKYELRYPWVYHSSVRKGYMCKYCEIFGHDISSESAFVKTGAILGTHPSRRLSSHESSARHIESQKRFSACTTNEGLLKSLMVKQKNSKTLKDEETVKKNRNYLKKLLKITVFLVKKKWGHTENLRDMTELVADLGDEEVKQMLNDRINYTSATLSSEMVKIISNFYENKVLTDLRGKKFTIFLDESTDNANRSQASIMARWNGGDGTKEQFLGHVHMTGTKAVDFEEAVSAFCLAKGINTADIRFVALDGCSTMSGVKTGLQKRIRHMAPHSQYINCRNHRLALCFVHLVKNQPHLADVEALLVSIWKLFHYSPKRNEVFHSMQEIYGEKTITFVKASATRWLSHLRASVRFISRYECILDTLDALIVSTRDPEIEGIRARATSQKIVLTILVLTDVLKPVNFLSLYLQGDIGYFTNLPERVKACTTDLHSIIAQYQGGDFQGLEFSKSEMITDVIRDRADLARRVRGEDGLVEPRAYLQNVGIPLVYELIGEVEGAFSEPSNVLSAFSVLDPSSLPDEVAEVNDYGKAKIHTLAQHYGTPQTDTFQGHRNTAPADIDIVVEQELLAFRTHLFLMKQRGVTSVAEVYRELNTDPGLRACFSRVKDLYQLATLIPQSTAVVERSFSLMNDLCTFLRSSLKTPNLDALMRINCANPKEEDFDQIVDDFKDFKSRQLPL